MSLNVGKENEHVLAKLKRNQLDYIQNQYGEKESELLPYKKQKTEDKMSQTELIPNAMDRKVESFIKVALQKID